MLELFYVHARAPVAQIVKGCSTTLRAPLAKVFLLSTKSGVGAVSEISPRLLARKVAVINHFEQLPFTNSQMAMDYAGFQRIEEDSVSSEENLLTRVFRRAKCAAVTLPPHATGAEIDRVRRMLDEA